MSFSLPDLEHILSLMNKYQVRHITLDNITITKDLPFAPPKQQKKFSQNPLDELLDITNPRDEEI